VILGCLDSRLPAEIIFDAGIGDTFTGRVAGNVVSDDMLGSIEFACGVSGAKVVLVLGRTACGAVKGAIDDVVLGNLTGLLARIKPAIPATKFDGENSPILEEMERKGKILMIGAMYNLTTGMVQFLS
jgi:carbonic anhydrase